MVNGADISGYVGKGNIGDNVVWGVKERRVEESAHKWATS